MKYGLQYNSERELLQHEDKGFVRPLTYDSRSESQRLKGKREGVI